jgi:DNA mismatch endonuclease (patch repair protein)
MVEDLSRFHGLTRSQLMSRIRSSGNKNTELALVKLLRANRINGWRRQWRIPLEVVSSALNVRRSGVSVRPDFVFPKQLMAVFVDGCFWHGCRWHCTYAKCLPKRSQLARMPSRFSGSSSVRTGKAFWRAKLASNVARDRFVTRQLRRQGWVVVRIWEHELRKGKTGCGKRVVAKIRRLLGRSRT